MEPATDAERPVLSERDVARRYAASARFQEVLVVLGATDSLVSAASGEGGPETDVERPDEEVLGAVKSIVTAGDLRAPEPIVIDLTAGGDSDGVYSSWRRHGALKIRGHVPMSAVMATFADQVRGLLAGAPDGGDGPPAAAPIRAEEVVETWSGRVVSLGDDHVWARLHSDADDADEDVQLLRRDFAGDDFDRLEVGTALLWHHESWTEPPGLRVSRSRVELLPAHQHDDEAGRRFAAAFRRLSGSPA